MTINDILKDKDYLGLPEKERKRVWEKLFDNQYSRDPDYLGLPPQEQARARTLYVSKLMEQDRQAASASLTGIKPYNPDADPINQAVNTRRITTFDSNIMNDQGVIKPNLEGYDTRKKITAKEFVDNKNRQAGREYSRKLAEDPFSHQQNPNAPGYMTTQLQREAGLDQIREEERAKKAKLKAEDIDQQMKDLENEYRDNDIRLVGMSARRDVWTDKEKDEYSTLLQRQAKIEVDAPAIAMGMSRRQYDAFQAGRELIKENPAWSYVDALGAGGVRLITSPYTLFAPGSELADVNRYADQGIASEGKVLGNIIRSTIASMPVNAAMIFAPQLAIPLTYTDITASNIKDYYDEKTLDASAMWASATSGLIQTAIEYGFDTAQMNLYRKAYREGGAAALKDTVKRSLQDATSNGIGKAARTVGKGTLTEMSEEVMQNVGDKIVRNVMNGDPLPQNKEELLAYGKELAMDAAGGAFGGFVMGSIGTGVKVGLHANSKAYIEFNALRYQSVALLSQALDQINAGDIQAAEQTLAQAKSQLRIDQITAKPLMRGFNLATDAINMAKAQQAVSVKVENEALADDIRKLTRERNSLIQEGHVAGFETPQGERLYTLEEQIKSKERQIKQNLSNLQKDKNLGKIAELYDMAKQFQAAGMPEMAEGMIDTAANVYQGIEERETELAPGESRSIEEDERITQEIAENTKKNKTILQGKLAAEQNKTLTETEPINTDQPAAEQGKQGAHNDSGNADRIPGERQERQTPVPPNPNPGTGQDTGKDIDQNGKGLGGQDQSGAVGDQPQEPDQSPLQKKGDLYIFRRKGRKPIFAVIERQDKNNFYTVDGKIISKKGKTAIKYPDYRTWANERSKSERRSLGSRKSFNTKFGDKTVISEAELKKLPYLTLFRGKTFSKGDASFQDVYVRVRGMKTEPLINVIDGHEGENWDTVIGEGNSSELPEFELAAETNDASLFLEKAEKEYYNYFYKGRSGAEDEITEQLRREGQAAEEERQYRKSHLESMSEGERNEFLDSLSAEEKEKYLESLRDDIESLDETSREFEDETGNDYENVQEYQEGDSEQQFDTSQYEDEVDLEDGIQDNLEGIEPILEGDELVDPKTGKTLFKTTKEKPQAQTDHLSNEMAEDALLGMIRSHIESIEHDGDTMTVNLKGGRTLTLNQITGDYQVKDHDGVMRTMRGKTDSSTINNNLKVVIDLVKGLNGGNRTLYHEAFHAAWRLFFTPAEVKLLIRYYSKRVGKNMIDIEEAAANAADQYLGNRNDVPPGLRTIFRRFWDRVRHLLVKIGFATDKQRVQDLFRRMENDQLTGEGVQDETDTTRHAYLGENIAPFAMNAAEQREKNILLMNRILQGGEPYIKGYILSPDIPEYGEAYVPVGRNRVDEKGNHNGFGLIHIREKHPNVTAEIIYETLEKGKPREIKDITNFKRKIDGKTARVGVTNNWDGKEGYHVLTTAMIEGEEDSDGINTSSNLSKGNVGYAFNSPHDPHPDTIVPKPDVTSRKKLLGVYGVMNMSTDKKLTKLMGDLNLAERMFREGYNAKAVRYATGWEIGIDGKWRYELPDIDVKIKNLGGYYMSIDGITQKSPDMDYPQKIKDKLLPHKLTKFPSLVIEGLEDSLLDAVFEQGKSTAGNWSEPIGWLSHESRLDNVIGDRELTPTERARVRRWIRANTKHILSLDLKQHKIEGKLQEYSLEHPAHALSYTHDNSKGKYWTIKLPELLDDKDLYKAYPRLKEIDVVFHPMKPGGYCAIHRNIIGIDIPKGMEPREYFVYNMLGWLRQVMLHEVQHAIQDIEVFAAGGNEKSADRDFPYSKMKPHEKYMHLLGEVESRNVEMRSRYDAKKLRNTPLEQTEDIDREKQLASTYDKASPMLFGDKMIRVKNYGGKLVPVEVGDWDHFVPPSIRARIEKEMASLKKNILQKDKIESGHYTAILGWLFEKGLCNYLATNRIDTFLEHEYQKAVEETKLQWRYAQAPKKWQDIYDKAWERIPDYLRKMTVIRPGINHSLWRGISPDELQSKETMREALIRNTWNREDDKSFAKQVVDQFFVELQSLPQAPKWGERLLGYANATKMSEALDKAFRETEKEIKNLKKVTKPHRQALMFALNLLDGEASDIVRIAAKEARITSKERVAAAAVRRYKTLPAEQQVKETMDLMYAAGRSLLEQKLPKRFSKDVLQNMISKDMKDEETIAFLLPDFLAQAPDMITKQELLKWMDDNEIEVQVNKLDGISSQYDAYSTKTGKNYREYLFNSPRAEGYKAPHFSHSHDKDLIMHMRLSDVEEKFNKTRIDNDKVKWLKPPEEGRPFAIRTTIQADARISEGQLREIDRQTQAPWAEYIHENNPEGVTAIQLYDLMVAFNTDMRGESESEAAKHAAEAFDAIGIQGIRGSLVIDGEAIQPPGLIIEELQSDYHQAARKGGYRTTQQAILTELNAAIGTNIRTLEQLAVEKEVMRREWEEKLREYNKANPPYHHLYDRIYNNKEGAIEELRKIKEAKPYFDILENIDLYAKTNKLTTQEKDKLIAALHDALFSNDNNKKSTGFSTIRATPVTDDEGIKGLLIHKFDVDMEEFSRSEFAKEYNSAKQNDSGFKAKHPDLEARLSQIATASRKIRELQDGASYPNIPFKKFHEFLFKYAILEAAQKGYGHIYWTTGDTQADRYGRNDEREQGMKGFYDDIVVKYANKLAKKYGVKADTKTLPGRYENGYKNIEFNHLEITPEMQGDLVQKGLPRYKTLQSTPDQQMAEVRKRYATPGRPTLTYKGETYDLNSSMSIRDIAKILNVKIGNMVGTEDFIFAILDEAKNVTTSPIPFSELIRKTTYLATEEYIKEYKSMPQNTKDRWEQELKVFGLVEEALLIAFKDSDISVGYIYPKHNSQYLKAPNGKPTNLNERQWLQVRTRNFKDWFGDWENDPKNASKVVDENGEPMVVYHGTAADVPFTEFMASSGALGKGIYASSNTFDASTYSQNRSRGSHPRIYPVFMNMRTPSINIRASEKFLSRYSKDVRKHIDATRHDYDGAIVAGEKIQEFMVKSPTQVKSATANTGAFDPQNPDIRYKLTDAYHGSGAFFDRFDVEFIGTGEGAQAFGWGIYVTEKKSVGKGYAEKVGGVKRVERDRAMPKIDGKTISPAMMQKMDRRATELADAGDRLSDEYMLNAIIYQFYGKLAYGDIDGIIDYLRRDIALEKEYARTGKHPLGRPSIFKPKPEFYERKLEWFMANKDRFGTTLTPKRHLYTVNVWEDRTEDVLEWRGEVTHAQLDKILKQAKIEGMDEENITIEPLDDEDRIIGERLYDAISTYMWWDVMPNEDISPDATDKDKETFAARLASEFLLRAGIDGIRYPVHATSGGTGEGGYNYVVFDANQISITHHERWKLLDEDIEERLRAAKKLLQQHNQEYAKITKEAAEKIAEKIVDETGVEPIAGKKKIARMIRAAYREGEEKARASMAILKIAGIGQKIATNKPETTDRSDMTFHLDEAEQYAKDMGISQDELDSLGADGYTFYTQGLNLFAYGNTLYDQLLEKRSQAAQNAAKGIVDQNLNEEIAILTSATADAVMRYDHIKTNAGRILRHAREEKSMRIGRLVQLSISLNEERDRQFAELADLQAELAENEKLLTELETAFEGLLDELERLTGQRYKSDYVDTLRKQKSDMEERIALVRNRTQSLTHRINQARETLKISESQITKIDEQIAKIELKLTPQEMQTLQGLAKSDKLDGDAKDILNAILKAWRPLTSAERNTLKNAHDTIASLSNPELAILKKLWERKHTISELPPLKPSKWDIARSIFYQNILSSPMTHVKNLVGNESNLALENLVNMIMDKGFASTLQSIADTKQGIKSAKAALQDGAEYMKKYDMSMTNARLMRKFTLVTRILAAEDAFYFRRGYGAQLMSLAIAESRKTGIAIQELLVNPTAAMIKQAEYEASRATFNYDPEGILGAVVSGVEKAFNTMDQLGAPGRATALLLKMKVLPFTRVVANVFNAGLDWTPLGFVGAVKYTGAVDKLQQRNIWKDANGKPIVSPYKNRDITRQLIRATLGTIGMALAYALLGDLMSGGGSDDPEERRQLQETGWKPYSIKIGDRWIPYTMLPISPALAVIANYREAQNRPNRKASAEESISYALMGIMNTMLDKSFLSGLSGVIEAVARKAKKYCMRALGETPAQVLPVSPNFFRFFNDLIYTRQHNPETTAQFMMYSLRPWTSAWMKEGIPTRIDVLGNETRKDPRWQEIIGSPIRDDQPLYVVDRDNIPTDIRTTLNAIMNSGLKIPSTTSHEIKIEDDQYITLKGFDKERYLRTRGMEISMSLVDNAERIESLADSGEIDELYKLLQKLGSEATRNAKKAMVDEYLAEETKHKYTPYSKSRDKE